MKHSTAFLAFFLILLAFPVGPSFAGNDGKREFNGGYQDGFDFMTKDGKMNKEEMEKESRYVFQQCVNNPVQNKYMNCECLAGAFLQQREKLGPTVLQFTIVENLYVSGNTKCANTEYIAGSTYNECLKKSDTFRELENDNEAYCTCVANKVARDFNKKPVANVSYIGSLNSKARVICNDPANRLARKPSNNEIVTEPSKIPQKK